MTEDEIRRANDHSIVEYLKKRGIEPVKRGALGAMYLSPIRAERNASFHVSYEKNTWYDFGIGRGGDLISLVRGMEGCDFSEAVRRILGGEYQSIPKKQEEAYESPSTLSLTRVIKSEKVSSMHLFDYAQKRGISEKNIEQWLREVVVEVGKKHFRALGFRNSSGGWEIRNEDIKISVSPKDITHISAGHATVTLFEGFFDFLSYLELERGQNPKTDFIVLNGVSFLRRSFDVLPKYEKIRLCLDNDKAGKEATKVIQEHFSDRTEDLSNTYRASKDLNESLQKYLQQKRELELQRQSQTGSFHVKRIKL
ncbi:MAG: toprim domain-containing protein [Alistipes sp.]|nr:toprim domain-containing protein [Candidatus Alistipes equi]